MESPILLVVHYEDGDWAFLDGGIVDEKDAAAGHLHHVFDDRDEVRSLTDLPAGWAGERTSEDAAWERYARPDDG